MEAIADHCFSLHETFHEKFGEQKAMIIFAFYNPSVSLSANSIYLISRLMQPGQKHKQNLSFSVFILCSGNVAAKERLW